MTTPLTITERAAKRIGQILKTEGDGTMLRISVEGGGCSGFQYKFNVERNQAERMPRDEHRISTLERIHQKQKAATHREEPERDWNHARPRPLRGDPLHQEARGEQALCHEAEHDPGIEVDDEHVVKVVTELL